MPAGKYNITLEQGANFFLEAQWADEDGVPINITGGAIASEVRVSFDDATEVVAFTCAITDGPNGRFTMSLTSSQTAALNFERGVYDIEIVLGPTTYRIFQGSVVLNKEATK